MPTASSASSSTTSPSSSNTSPFRRNTRSMTRKTVPQNQDMKKLVAKKICHAKEYVAVEKENTITSSTDTSGPLKKKKPQFSRQKSLREIANQVRQSTKTTRATESMSPSKQAIMTTSTNASGSGGFVAVASKVVQSQRAVKGFKGMWAKGDNPLVESDLIIDQLHVEKKKLDLVQFEAEYKEDRRSQFYQELLVYLVFLAVFLSLLGWLPVYDSFEQSTVVKDLICVEPKSCEISTIDELYDFSDHLHKRICDAQQQVSIHNRWMRIGSVRFRQVRVKSMDCAISETTSTECYPEYQPDLQDKSPIVGDSGNVYVWKDGYPVLQPWLRPPLFVLFQPSYGTGGYAVDLCDISSKNASSSQRIDQLIEDEWVGIGTRAVALEFTLMNPATRMLTIGYHVITINPSGYIEHYAQGANARLAIDAKTSIDLAEGTYWSYIGALASDFRILCWVCCLLFLFTYVLAEWTEILKIGWRSYFTSDTWNLFEWVQLYVLGSVLYHSFQYYVISYRTSRELTAFNITPGSETYINMQPLLLEFQRLSDFAAVASGISFFKIFKFLRMNSTLSLLWKVLGMASRDLMGFLVIFNLIFFAYSSMGVLAFGFALEEFKSFRTSYATCFQMVAGDFDYDKLHQANPRLAPLFFGSFIVLVLQIVVNMFVAILSEYYEVAKDSIATSEDVEYDVINRLKGYLHSCSPTVVLPKNQPLQLKIGQKVRLISTNLVDKEVTRQRAKKLFRGAVWRIVALLRFGMKFDRKINFKRRSNDKDAPGSSNQMVYIPLSENFDHDTIKDMLPKGITIRLEGDSLLGTDILLRVERHSSFSIECKVLKDPKASDKAEQELREDEALEGGVEESERPLELLGGESLIIPTRYFVWHVVRTIVHQFQVGIMRATKFWNPVGTQLVDDYHLHRLLRDARQEGRLSLRFDELFGIVNLYLRKDRKGGALITPEMVKKETAYVMYRYRNSLTDMPSREKEGHNYKPSVLDTSKIELGSLEYLSEMLAENCHDIWALERLKQGWTYGPERDCDIKTHPNLVPYHLLPKSEQMFDYRTSMETLKTILTLNFQIVRKSGGASSYLRGPTRSLSANSSGAVSSSVTPTAATAPSSSGGTELRKSNSRNVHSLLRRLSSGEESNSEFFSVMENGELYYPRPIDTNDVGLPIRLNQLVDLLANNAHEVWAQGRMEEGWLYGSTRDDKNKRHPCLVPFVFLTDVEKEYDVNTAMGTLKMLLAMGFDVVDKETG